MNFSYYDLVSINEIKADVLVELNDEEERKLTPGYYRAKVKEALDELGFDTFFVDIYEDIETPDDLKLHIPKGSFNLIGLYGYMGTPDNITYGTNIYWKRRFITKGKNTGYTADSKEWDISDPFIKAPSYYVGEYYFNIQNGVIMLSDTCDVFDYIRVYFNGVPSSVLDIDGIKIVPPMVRKAVTLWVVEKCARALKPKDKDYRQIQIDAAAQLDEYGLNGAWYEAKKRLSTMDKKQMRDFIKYQSKMI